MSIVQKIGFFGSVKTALKRQIYIFRFRFQPARILEVVTYNSFDASVYIGASDARYLPRYTLGVCERLSSSTGPQGLYPKIIAIRSMLALIELLTKLGYLEV